MKNQKKRKMVKLRVLNTRLNSIVSLSINQTPRHGLRNVLLLHLSFFIGLRSKEMGALNCR